MENRELNFFEARVINKNFSGNRFVEGGAKGFGIVLENVDAAEKMRADGWPVRILAPRTPDEAPLYWLPVAVRFDHVPPKVYVIANGRRRELDDSTVGELDHAVIRTVDAQVHAYHWQRNGQEGYKVYLSKLYVPLQDNPFEEKWGNIQ